MRQSAQEREEDRKPKTGKEKYLAQKSKEDESKAARDLKRSESDTPARYARTASCSGEPFSFTQISITDCVPSAEQQVTDHQSKNEAHATNAVVADTGPI